MGDRGTGGRESRRTWPVQRGRGEDAGGEKEAAKKRDAVERT